METIGLSQRYSEIFRAFSMDPEKAVEQALQRYAVTLISDKIDEFKRRDREFQEKYACEFEEFAKRTATDTEYIEKLEKGGRLMWESDIAEWEFCRKGVADWTERLTRMLTN